PPSTHAVSTLSLHDALPISARVRKAQRNFLRVFAFKKVIREAAGGGHPRENPTRERKAELFRVSSGTPTPSPRQRKRELARRPRSEEHTSELQSLTNLVCRL